MAPFLRLKNKMSARERIGLQYISIVYYSLGDLVLKVITNQYSNTNVFSMMFFQSISLILFTYYDIKNFGINYPNLNEYKKIIFIVIRGLANCFINIFITLATYHVKYAIIITILFTNSILTSIFSIFYLKEKFHLRYLIGFFLSFLGLYLFAFSNVSTEKSEKTDLLSESSNTTLGLFYAFMASLSISIFIIMNQRLKDEVHPCILNNYCGWIGLFFSIPFLFFIKSFETASGYVLMNFLNSLFFHIASTFHSISMIYNSLILIGTLSFSSIILAFLYGLFLFGESLKIKEFLGIVFIISYNVYSIFYPIEQKDECKSDNERKLLDEDNCIKDFIANDNM